MKHEDSTKEELLDLIAYLEAKVQRLNSNQMYLQDRVAHLERQLPQEM